MDMNDLPILDWPLALRLSGNHHDIAEEIHALFIASLPNELAQLTISYQNQNYVDLLYQTHKLHGALCYLGAPRLKTVVSRLETNLKKHIMVGLPSLFEQLNIEVNLLLETYSRHISTFGSKA